MTPFCHELGDRGIPLSYYAALAVSARTRPASFACGHGYLKIADIAAPPGSATRTGSSRPSTI